MTFAAWDEGVELPEASTWLLEASAGTGKTYQIAGLFVRLVAEYDVPVERVLTITFTNAATAELRDRIRARLRAALDALRAGTAPKDDAVVARLVASAAHDAIEKRIELALRGFDLAPISTIHGFSQRMLRELAFDSGQDPELELLADASEVIDEVVDDTLATIYAGTPAGELALLAEAGMTRSGLLAAARAMAQATLPRVAPEGSADLREELAHARAWATAVRRMRERWESADGRSALALLREDAQNKQFKKLQHAWIASSIDKIDAWLGGGALGIDKTETSFVRLRTATLAEAWKGSPAQLSARPWWPLLGELDAFAEEHDRVYLQLAPLAGFARTVRARVEAELLRRRALTFDGMLSRLAERIAATGGADSPLAARIRERFDAVLVDEFQDTDASQWSVLRAAFHGKRRLLLIGDPKQAIYAFRGADVRVFLEAARLVEASRRRTMVENFRSDPRAVAAMNALFRAGSRAFDDEAIDYVEIAARRPDRLDPKGAGLEVRWLDDRARGGHAGAPISSKDDCPAARLAAREALAWLEGRRAKIISDEGARDVEPGDLAVLVNDRNEARDTRRALARVGVPAVAASKGSVFDAEVATWLAAWLDAVAGRGRDRSARAAVVTPLFGWSAEELAWALAVADRGDDARAEALAAEVHLRDWDAWTSRLDAAAERWPRHGFARTFDREATDLRVLPRVLASPAGERHATDLRHLFELLHAEERARRAGPGALAAWLRAQAGAERDETVQRLESDARAVQIETVHASKGLEYPVVLLPFAWAARSGEDRGKPFVVRGPANECSGAAPGGAVLHVEMLGSPARAEARARLADEERREALRKTYVALTRAKHRTIAWLGPVGKGGTRMSATALGRLVFRDPARPGFDDDAMPYLSGKDGEGWAEAERRLEALTARSAGAIAWSAEDAQRGVPRRWRPPAQTRIPPRAAAWPAEREVIESPFVVTSYSGLVAQADRDEKLAREVTASSGRPRSGHSDREGSRASRPALATFPDLPRLSLGGGTRYGTTVHAVLEQLDFTTARAKDGRPLAELVALAAERTGLAGEPALAAELVARLPAVLATPLDGAHAARAPVLPPGLSLREIARADRFDEVAFDLRLGDGARFRRAAARASSRGALDAIDGCVDPSRLLAALLAAREACDGGIGVWLDEQLTRHRAGRPLVGSVAGILTGSIDLVFRAADGRYFLADYKTNRVDTSAPGHYAAAWLELEMADAGYPLQALLYTLALHRHLRSRLRGYEYDRHVGGYLYLFLRGMAGPETPRDPDSGRCLGVFADRWPRAVVEAFDEALCPKGEGAR